MCTIRLSTHYYGQINNFHQKRKNNIFLCLWILSEGKQWHSMVHKSCQKAHGRPAKLIFQCMWHKIFVNGEPGMKNHVDCIWLALLVQPNVGGTNEFFTHPKWIFYPSKMDFYPSNQMHLMSWRYLLYQNLFNRKIAWNKQFFPMWGTHLVRYIVAIRILNKYWGQYMQEKVPMMAHTQPMVWYKWN